MASDTNYQSADVPPSVDRDWARKVLAFMDEYRPETRAQKKERAAEIAKLPKSEKPQTSDHSGAYETVFVETRRKPKFEDPIRSRITKMIGFEFPVYYTAAQVTKQAADFVIVKDNENNTFSVFGDFETPVVIGKSKSTVGAFLKKKTLYNENLKFGLDTIPGYQGHQNDLPAVTQFFRKNHIYYDTTTKDISQHAGERLATHRVAKKLTRKQQIKLATARPRGAKGASKIEYDRLKDELYDVVGGERLTSTPVKTVAPVLFNPESKKPPQIEDILGLTMSEASVNVDMPKLRELVVGYMTEVLNKLMGLKDGNGNADETNLSTTTSVNAQWAKNNVEGGFKTHDKYVDEQFELWLEADINRDVEEELAKPEAVDFLFEKTLFKLRQNRSVDFCIAKFIKKYPDIFKTTAMQAVNMIKPSPSDSFGLFVRDRLETAEQSLSGLKLAMFIADAISQYHGHFVPTDFFTVYGVVYGKEFNKIARQFEGGVNKKAAKKAFEKEQGKQLKSLYKTYKKEHGKEVKKLEKTLNEPEATNIGGVYGTPVMTLKDLRKQLKHNESVVYQKIQESNGILIEYMAAVLYPTVFLSQSNVGNQCAWAHAKVEHHMIDPSTLYKNTLVNYFPEFAISLLIGDLDEEMVRTVEYEITNTLARNVDVVMSTYMSLTYPGVHVVVPDASPNLVEWGKALVDIRDLDGAQDKELYDMTICMRNETEVVKMVLADINKDKFKFTKAGINGWIAAHLDSLDFDEIYDLQEVAETIGQSGNPREYFMANFVNKERFNQIYVK
jgi:hypothetical protein